MELLAYGLLTTAVLVGVACFFLVRDNGPRLMRHDLIRRDQSRIRFATDPCVAGRHHQCYGAEDGSQIELGEMDRCPCSCHDDWEELE